MNLNYAATALYAYPSLERLIKHLDETAKSKAIHSHKQLRFTFAQYEKIVKIQMAKVDLMDLKEAMDSILSSCNEKELHYLDLAFFRTKEPNSIDRKTLSSKMYFRTINKLLDRFMFGLKRQGFDDDWWEEALDSRWLGHFYQRALAREKRVKRSNAIITEYNNKRLATAEG